MYISGVLFVKSVYKIDWNAILFVYLHKYAWQSTLFVVFDSDEVDALTTNPNKTVTLEATKIKTSKKEQTRDYKSILYTDLTNKTPQMYIEKVIKNKIYTKLNSEFSQYNICVIALFLHWIRPHTSFYVCFIQKM